MKGKTVGEAEAELKKSGMSEDKIKQILPHKVRKKNFFLVVEKCCTVLTRSGAELINRVAFYPI